MGTEKKLVGDQKELDVDNDNDIDASDLKKLREQRQEGGSIDDQMMMVMTPPIKSEMESDDDMEDGYTQFIMEEALTEEEEDMLMSKLEQDEELAMLFDKVIDVAQEFAGSGPVEGPGSGVSDSIPARLSDGEFVFTAKAVEEIGADNLMAMMKDAEMKADERQGLADGGMPEDEQPETVTMVAEQAPIKQDIRVTKETVGTQAAMQEEEDLVGDEIKKGMLSARPYVRSQINDKATRRYSALYFILTRKATFTRTSPAQSTNAATLLNEALSKEKRK